MSAKHSQTLCHAAQAAAAGPHGPVYISAEGSMPRVRLRSDGDVRPVRWHQVCQQGMRDWPATSSRVATSLLVCSTEWCRRARCRDRGRRAGALHLADVTTVTDS